MTAFYLFGATAVGKTRLAHALKRAGVEGTFQENPEVRGCDGASAVFVFLRRRDDHLVVTYWGTLEIRGRELSFLVGPETGAGARWFDVVALSIQDNLRDLVGAAS